jgi:hypothetical protein
MLGQDHPEGCKSMSNDDRVLELLGRIEENQRKALEAQQQHLQIAQAQLDRSNKTIQESIELQRTAVARQGQITKIVLPLVAVLLALLAYLLIKYRVL